MAEACVSVFVCVRERERETERERSEHTIATRKRASSSLLVPNMTEICSPAMKKWGCRVSRTSIYMCVCVNERERATFIKKKHIYSDFC